MRYINRWIADSEYEFLEVAIYDAQDVEELSNYKKWIDVCVIPEEI